MKESVTKFDLEAAFKALDELDIPVAKKGIAANRVNLKETFNRKLKTEALIEDYYDVNDTNDLEQASEDRQAEVAQAKLARIEKIVDLDAETEEDILPSYEGKIIVQCPQCMTLFYKKPEDIEASEDDDSIVNVGEVCQHCGNESGYTVIGKVAAVEPEGEETEEMDELNLDFEEPEDEESEEEPIEEPTEEVSEEEPAEEETSEEELELAPVEEEEDKKEESLDSSTKTVLTEDTEDTNTLIKSDDVDNALTDTYKKGLKSILIETDRKDQQTLKTVIDWAKKNNIQPFYLNVSNGALNYVLKGIQYKKDNKILTLEPGLIDSLKTYDKVCLLLELNHFSTLQDDFKKLLVELIKTHQLSGPDSNYSLDKIVFTAAVVDDPEKYSLTNEDKAYFDKVITVENIEESLDKTTLKEDIQDNNIEKSDLDSEEEPTEVEVSEEEFEETEDALDVLKDKIDVHGEGKTVVIAEKGQLDNEEAPKVEVEVSEEESDVLEKEFHEEETEETKEEEPTEEIEAEVKIEDEIATPEEAEAEIEAEAEATEEIPADIEEEKVEEALDETKEDSDETLNESSLDDFKELIDSKEFKTPISDAEVQSYLTDSLDEATDIINLDDIDEIDEDTVNLKITESLTAVYENVKNFELSSTSINANNQLVLEGMINFNSGNSKKANYVFTEAKKENAMLIFEGYNAELDPEGKFYLNCTLNNDTKKLIAEKFNYSYHIGDTLIENLK